MKGRLYLVLLIIIAGLTFGCFEDSKQNGDVDVFVSESTFNYVWDYEITITAEPENVDKVDYVKFYVNDELIQQDGIAPYEKTVSTNGWDYQTYELKAKAVYEDGSSTTEVQSVEFVPCPIYSEDVTDIEGITETSSTNQLIGNVDSDDWDIENGFGTAFPNPTSAFVTIPFELTEQDEVSMIIINDEFEIVETLLDNQVHSAGNHEIQWGVPENISDIYRVIIHYENGFHAHGDIIAE